MPAEYSPLGRCEAPILGFLRSKALARSLLRLAVRRSSAMPLAQGAPQCPPTAGRLAFFAIAGA
jgi:hypothetical protein